jgi:dethiobiotin synthase
VAPLRYWKPIQTGIEHDDDTRAVEALTGLGPESVLNDGVRLPRPVSPHLAAQLSGQRIDLAPLLALARAQPRHERFVVEGAGGALVPINESEMMVDLILQLGLAALVVARSTLGTINHTLLTLEALRGRGVPVAGVVMNGPRNDENCDAIQTFGRVAVIGRMATFDALDRTVLAGAAASIDADDRLVELFR